MPLPRVEGVGWISDLKPLAGRAFRVGFRREGLGLRVSRQPPE